MGASARLGEFMLKRVMVMMIGAAICVAGATALTTQTYGVRASEIRVVPLNDIAATLDGPAMQRVSTLVALIKAADLENVLRGPGPFTLFAPTNQAFAKLPPGEVDELLKPRNKEKLRSLLLHHVHQSDAIKLAQMRTMSLSTLGGRPLSLQVDQSDIRADGARSSKTM
jgi:uncharacterized surface protein with fasciclin (FAS1) repeats